jgi:hypothetical protein
MGGRVKRSRSDQHAIHAAHKIRVKLLQLDSVAAIGPL